jgi:hypothetical protein
MRGFPIATLVACFVFGGALMVPACSSDANDSADAAGIADVLFPQSCTSPIQIGSGDPSRNTYPGGACSASLANLTCTYQAPESCTLEDITIYTCTCDGTSWSCMITGDVEGGSCDAGSIADAGMVTDGDSDADVFDASDASDGDAF